MVLNEINHNIFEFIFFSKFIIIKVMVNSQTQERVNFFHNSKEEKKHI